MLALPQLRPTGGSGRAAPAAAEGRAEGGELCWRSRGCNWPAERESRAAAPQRHVGPERESPLVGQERGTAGS